MVLAWMFVQRVSWGRDRRQAYFDIKVFNPFASDVRAESGWGRDRRQAYFDIKVYNPFASSYAASPLTQCYRRAELDKRRKYDERIREVERGTFSPLISSSGGMGPTARVVYKRIATFISEKRGHPYSQVLHWTRGPQQA